MTRLFDILRRGTPTTGATPCPLPEDRGIALRRCEATAGRPACAKHPARDNGRYNSYLNKPQLLARMGETPAINTPQPPLDLPRQIEAILQAMSDGLWVCSTEPRLLWINRACEELNDIRAEEVCGRPVSELLAIGNFDHDAATQVLNQRRPVAINQHVKSGAGRNLLMNAVPVFDAGGEIAYVVGTERTWKRPSRRKP